MKEQPGSSAVVQGISSDEQGIGYSGIGYVTSGVKTLSLAEKAERRRYSLPTITASTEHTHSPVTC